MTLLTALQNFGETALHLWRAKETRFRPAAALWPDGSANLADPQEAGAVETEKVAARGAGVTSSALAAMSNSAMPMVANAAHDIPLPLAANDAAADRTDPKPAMGPAGASDSEAHAISASAPLPGPIRLPRPRPHNAGTIRTADTTLSHVPMPRPRPVADAVGRSD